MRIGRISFGEQFKPETAKLLDADRRVQREIEYRMMVEDYALASHKSVCDEMHRYREALERVVSACSGHPWPFTQVVESVADIAREGLGQPATKGQQAAPETANNIPSATVTDTTPAMRTPGLPRSTPTGEGRDD